MAGVVQQLSIEEKINEDFLFFLEHFKAAFDSLKSESEKEICKVTNYIPNYLLGDFVFIYVLFI